jgi:hypothetical protein
MGERSKVAFEFARDTTKEFIAFASAIIALTITFSKDFISGAGEQHRDLALWSWGAFLASIFFGLLTLLALTGMLGDSKPLNIYKPSVRVFSGLQILLFFVGLILTVVFAVKSVDSRPVRNEGATTGM